MVRKSAQKETGSLQQAEQVLSVTYFYSMTNRVITYPPFFFNGSANVSYETVPVPDAWPRPSGWIDR